LRCARRGADGVFADRGAGLAHRQSPRRACGQASKIGTPCCSRAPVGVMPEFDAGAAPVAELLPALASLEPAQAASAVARVRPAGRRAGSRQSLSIRIPKVRWPFHKLWNNCFHAFYKAIDCDDRARGHHAVQCGLACSIEPKRSEKSSALAHGAGAVQ
jgi:hypothetical protein